MNVIHPQLVKTNFPAESKEECLRNIVQSYKEAGVIDDAEAVYRKLMAREKKLSTGIGHGIAIPHLRDESVNDLTVGIYLLDKEIDFDSLDKKKVKFVIAFAIPVEGGNEYMKILQRFCDFLRNEKNREFVFNCHEPSSLLEKFRSLLK